MVGGEAQWGSEKVFKRANVDGRIKYRKRSASR